MTTPSALSGLLFYGALESLLNRVLTSDVRGREQLAALDGTVVRLRGEQPMWVLYVLIYEDGVELLGEYEGPVDVRVRGPLGAMLHWLLVPNSNDADSGALRVTGPSETLDRLNAMIGEFSLWPLVRGWLDDHVRLQDLLDLLRREDPAWLEKLAGLPDHIGALAAQVAQQRLLQEDILEEVRGLRTEMRRARRLDLAFMVIGIALIALSLLRALGQWQQTWLTLAHDPISLALISLGLALIAGRLVLRSR